MTDPRKKIFRGFFAGKACCECVHGWTVIGTALPCSVSVRRADSQCVHGAVLVVTALRRSVTKDSDK